jgi:hypothetical protein
VAGNAAESAGLGDRACRPQRHHAVQVCGNPSRPQHRQHHALCSATLAVAWSSLEAFASAVISPHELPQVKNTKFSLLLQPTFPFSYNRSIALLQLHEFDADEPSTSPHNCRLCLLPPQPQVRPPCSNRSRASGDAASDRRPPGCLQRLQVRTLQRLLLHIYIHFRCHRYHRTMSALTFLAQVSRLLHQLLEL